MDLLSIDHVCLFVSNLENSKLYYEKVFGFVCNPHPKDDSILMVENENIHFFLKKVAIPESVLENQHLSFKVSDINKVVDTLHKNGIHNYEVGEFTHFKFNNYKWLEWRDPDGIRLECVETV